MLTSSGMDVSRFRLGQALLALAFLALTLPQVLPALQLEMDGKSITATEVEPGGLAVVYGIGLTAGEGGIRRLLEVREVVEDENQDGAVEFEPGYEIPLQSVWAVVDLTSGQYAVASPTGSAAVEVDFPGRGPERGSLGQLNRLRHEGLGFVHLLVVRAGEGAWALTSSDGGPFDVDGAFHNGVLLELDLVEGFPGFVGLEPPEAFQPGDTVVVIDSDTLRHYSTQLPGGGS